MIAQDVLDQISLQGWAVVPPEPRLLAWVKATRPAALATLDAPRHANWWRHGHTWFAGVNVLDNDGSGAVRGGPVLAGAAIEFLNRHCPDLAWDRAQISVCREGYPIQDGESDAAFAFRNTRDAAHLDGLLPVGPKRQRHLQELHRFILGIPLTFADEHASPLVVWEGSHHLIKELLDRHLCEHDPQVWHHMDLTKVYTATRRRAFAECRRRIVTVPVGGCYILHRHLIHGVQPWRPQASADPVGRAIAYFRPEAKNKVAWASAAPLV